MVVLGVVSLSPVASSGVAVDVVVSFDGSGAAPISFRKALSSESAFLSLAAEAEPKS